MNKPLTAALGVALIVSLFANGYLYQSMQKSPEVIYLDPPEAEQLTEAENEVIYIHVSGAVHRPGVYELPVGSRAFFALEKAGGALEGANVEAVNLARVLFDGEKLHIYEAAAEGQEPHTPVAQTDTRININTASQNELESLPNIGPAKALAIINYRTQNGSFRAPEDLM